MEQSEVGAPRLPVFLSSMYKAEVLRPACPAWMKTYTNEKDEPKYGELILA